MLSSSGGYAVGRQVIGDRLESATFHTLSDNPARDF